jgi:hypothetical protein
MTEEDTLTAACARVPFSKADIIGLRGLTAQEIAAIFRTYENDGKPISQTAWQDVCGFLAQCSSTASMVTPILAALQILIVII